MLLLLLSLAHAEPSSAAESVGASVGDLAPGPRELNEAQDELVTRIETAEAIERAVARLQSAFLTTPATDELCRDPLRGPVVVRLRLFAEAWHDAAQRTRVQARRVARTAAAPTVTPMIDPDRREAIDRLLERAKAQEAAWLEFVAWADSTTVDVCDLQLLPMPGIPDPIVRGQGEIMGGVAVTTSSEGYVCPGAVAAPSGAVLILPGPSCYAKDPSCGCEAAAIDPGAVLGN